MTDALIPGAAIALASKLLYDVIGPSAKNLGEILRDLQDYRLRNWLKIAKASERAGGVVPAGSSVHPRVAEQIITQSTWLDDDVMQAYAGGLLAASRSENGADDRGAYYVRILNGLTSTQTRLHFLIYSELYRNMYRTPGESSVREIWEWRRVRLTLPVQSLAEALFPLGDGYDSSDGPLDFYQGKRNVAKDYRRITEALHALRRDLLVADYFESKAPPGTQGGFAPIKDMEFEVGGSELGLALFCWAHGYDFSDPATVFVNTLPEFDPPGPKLIHS